jgi:hypothetical protein
MAALAIGLAGAGMSQAQQVVNMLANGGFETGVIGPYGLYGSGTATVVTECAGAAVAEGPIEGKYCLNVKVAAAGANNWDVGMTNGTHTFKQGKKYTFACFMKTKSGTLQVRLKPERGADPWTAYGEVVVTVTDKWTEYWTTTPVMTADVNPASPTFHFAFAPGDFWIDGVRLYEGDYVPPAFLKNYAAKDPSPAEGATDVAREVVLGWQAGPFAATHNVFFGTSFDDVNDATVPTASGLTGTSFDPEAVLEFGKTYYWRVDEVNAPSAPATFKGKTWSFTTEPYAYTVTGVTATASSSTKDMGPEKTVDGSGLTGDLHSSVDTAMWLSGAAAKLPAWIQYRFDRVYKLVDMKVWNSNQKVESFIGFGARSTTIEYSVDGQTWNTLSTVEIPRATGADGYAGSVIDLAGIEAKFVKLTISGSWGGFIPQAGLSEVRFTYVPVAARVAAPANGAEGVSLDPLLNWRPGRDAVSHKVYLSGDRQAVANGTALVGTETDVTYQVSGLEYGKTYYWKVDEVAEGSAVQPGEIWSFSTTEFMAVDDFDSYTDDEGSRIYETWIDGLTTGASGSTVGHLTAPFAEQSIVHSGRQSMPMDYDNTKAPFYSEAERAFDTQQNWTTSGISDLILYVQGTPALGTVAITETGGKITLTGAGADIWGNSDQFTYACKTLNGDGSMVARVVSNGTGTNTWAKGGVMIRDSLNGGSTHAMMVITGGGGNGASFQWRDTTNGVSVSADSASVVAPPYWVKMERSGASLNGFVSADGKAWNSLGSAFIAMDAPVYIGLCVTSHVAGVDRTFQFDNISASSNVAGAWQGATIVASQHNSPEKLYVTVQDSAGKKATASNTTAVTSGSWAEVRFPLKSFTGVNMAKVAKLVIGVGDKASPKAGGVGRIYVDDIRVGRLGSSDPGLGVAYYAMENGVTDGSGNGRDGTLVGAPVFIDGPAGMGKALQFDGVTGGQRVTIGTWNPSADTGRLSVSLWAKWGGLTTFYQGLIGKRDSWAANDMMWQIEANITTGVLRLQREGAEVVGPTIPVGEWTHIVGAFDGAAAKMYVNGSVVGQGALTLGTDPGALIAIGDSVGGGGNPFNGGLDEIRIYDRVLSSFEVSYLAGTK